MDISTAVILTIALVAVFYLIAIYNRLVALRNRFRNAFAQIEVQLKRRHDLIPNLVEVAKRYLAHERDTLEAVTVARQGAVAGLSRAAHFGVLVKGAKPLEAMARIRTLILDKTGTLTDGRPQIVSIDSDDGMGVDDILRYAAALDQASKHPVAQAIVAAARDRGLTLGP